MGMLIVRIPRETGISVTHSVRLDVGLIHHIESIPVTEVIPLRGIRVVTCADSIYIQLLHDEDVLDHIFTGDHISPVGADLMSVRTLDEDRPAVDQELSVLHTDIPEAHAEGSRFSLSLPVEGSHLQGVEPRSLCSPLLNIIHSQACADHRQTSVGVHGSPDRKFGRRHLLTVLVQKFHSNLCHTLGQFDLQVGCSVSMAHHIDILYPSLRTGGHIGIPRQTGEPEEVLVLKIGSVAPPENLQSDKVLPRPDIFRDVEPGFQLAVLAVAHLLAVDPHPHARSRRPYMQEYVLALP